MSGLTIHLAGPGHADALQRVWAWVYQGEAPADDEMAFEEGTDYFLAEQSGQGVAACQVHRLEIARGGSTYPCGGVAAVGTLAEHRGRGLGSEFMAGLLPVMRERGHVLASLYGYREPFYRKAGYASCGWRWQVQCPQHRLPRTERSLEVRQISPDQLTRLDAAYVPFARARSGCHLRSGSDWTHRMGKKPPMVYAVGDPVEAYAWATYHGFWVDMAVGEIAWSTRRGYDSILHVLAGLAVNQTGLVWNEPPDSPFFALYQDQGVTTSRHRPTMFRALDVPRALRGLVAEEPGEFTIEVADDQIPENSGPWRVAYSPAGVEVAPGGEPGLRTTVPAFSQALMGQPSLSELVRLGEVEVRDLPQLHAASRLLTPMSVVCMEFF